MTDQLKQRPVDASVATTKANRINARSRRTASKAVRREQLIEATIESISRYGISGTTMNTVTGFAGLSVGIVNFHFKNKETLYQETLRFLGEEHRDLWKDDLEKAGDDLSNQLLAIVDSHFHPNLCSRNKLTVWFAFYGEAGYRQRYRALMQEIDAERWDILRNLCSKMISQGGYSDLNVESVIKTLEVMFDGFWLNMLIYPNQFHPDDGKRQIRDFLALKLPEHFSATNPHV
jgi:TetR/AcrR family transcriptional repressor of bet genes